MTQKKSILLCTFHLNKSPYAMYAPQSMKVVGDRGIVSHVIRKKNGFTVLREMEQEGWAILLAKKDLP